MADHAFDEQLARFSDAVFSGRNPDADGVDDGLAQTIRRIQSLDQVPTPSYLRMKQIKESVMHTSTIQLTPFESVASFSPNGARPAIPPSFAAHGVNRRIFVAAALTVALLVLLGGGAYQIRETYNAALAPAVQTTEPQVLWPNYRGDAGRTGTMPGPGIVGTPASLWQVKTDGSITDSAALANGVLYVPTDGSRGLVAYDAATGAERWHKKGVGGRPALANSLLIARTERGEERGLDLVALDAATGDVRWRVEGTQTIYWSPVIDDGVIYIPASDNLMQAIDLETGATRWSIDLRSPVSRSVALSDDLVILGCEDGTIHALSRADGSEQWSLDVGEGTLGVPAVRGGAAFVSLIQADQPQIISIDLATGLVNWKYAPVSTAGLQAAAVTDEFVLLPSQDGSVSAIRVDDGSLAWRFQTNSGLSAAPVVVDGTVYEPGGDGNLYGIDVETGAEEWTFPIDAPSSVESIVAGGVVYVSDEGGSIYAIRGDETPSIPAPASIVAGTPIGIAAATFVRELKGDAIPLSKPGDIAIDPTTGLLWIPDAGNSRFLIYDADGTLVETWGEQGSGAGQFNFLDYRNDGWGGIAFAHDGSFYVADTGNFRIQHFAADRTYLNSWGARGSDDGDFLKLLAISVGPEGSIYAVDDDRNDVQQFDSEGTFVRKWGTTGNGPGEFGDQLTLLSVDQDGRVWVADNSRGMIHEFTADGSWVADLGSPGQGDGEFDVPADVAVDADGRIFVSDMHRIQVFDSNGHFLAAWGEIGSGPGEIDGGGGLVLPGHGTIYVVDYFNNRIQEFELAPQLRAS